MLSIGNCNLSPAFSCFDEHSNVLLFNHVAASTKALPVNAPIFTMAATPGR